MASLQKLCVVNFQLRLLPDVQHNAKNFNALKEFLILYLLTSSEVDRQVLSALQKKIEVKFKGQTKYLKDDYVIYLTGLKVEDLREFLIFEDVKRKNHLYSKHVLYYLKDDALTFDAISISGIESKIRLVEKELFKKFSIIKSNDI